MSASPVTGSTVTASPDPARQLLRHTLATVAYRGGKALRGAPDHFGTFHIGDKTRTPAQIRSEEHTSELQSQSNLVCRLLLEKKKKHRLYTSCIHRTTA